MLADRFTHVKGPESFTFFGVQLHVSHLKDTGKDVEDWLTLGVKLHVHKCRRRFGYLEGIGGRNK